VTNLAERLRDSNRRGEYEDFVQRFEKGAPWEGIDDDEARRRYDEVSSDLSDDDYELSAREAFERLDPEQRKEMTRLLRQQGRERNVDLGEFDRDDDDERMSDPQQLARMTRKVRKQQPGGLAALLDSGGGGGMLGNPIAKAALAGVAAMAAKRVMR
jgi:hypothetical protein